MNTFARLAVCLGAAVALTAPAFAQDAAAALPVATCLPSQLTLTADGGDGRFDATSHSGTWLVLRNVSSSACRTSPFADLTLQQRDGSAQPPIVIEPKTAYSGPVANGRRIPMGHGPVVLPIVLAPGEAARAELIWVSGPVYADSVCVDTVSASVAVGAGAVRAPLGAHICGPDASHVSASLTRLAHYPRAPVSGI